MSSSIAALRRSAAEILAYSALELFPSTKLIGGRATEVGFYYEFVFSHPFDRKSLALIEETMIRFLKKNGSIKAVEMMRENAVTLFRHLGQEALATLVATDPNNIVEVFRLEEFYGYSPAPYIKNTKEIGACKLLGFSQRKQAIHGKEACKVTRIDGVAFQDAKSLKKFIKRYEAAKKRDHQKLGPELGLFCHQEGAAPGCWSWLPKGEILRENLLDFWRDQHRKQGYHIVSTPRIIGGDRRGPQKSPKFDIEGENFVLAGPPTPMHLQLFRSKTRSYRELPFRLAEISEVICPVKSRNLKGLFRSRLMVTDTAHDFCSEDKALDELISSLHFIRKTINIFGVESKWYLVSKKPKSLPNKDDWDRGIELIVKAAKQLGLDYAIDSEETATNGPRIEGRFIDALGREWPGPNVRICSFDKSMECHYHSCDGECRRPVVIGRSLFGSLERFVAILVESYTGFFPLWLAPEQVRVIPVKENHQQYAEKVRDRLQGFRVGVDNCCDTLAAKVYATKRAKVPYVVIVGDSEQQNGKIAVSSFQDQGKGRIESIEVFLEILRKEIAKNPLPILEETKSGDKRRIENK